MLISAISFGTGFWSIPPTIFRFLRYRYNYKPPVDLESQVKKAVDEVLVDASDDVRSIDLTKNRRLKFQVSFVHYECSFFYMRILLKSLREVSNLSNRSQAATMSIRFHCISFSFSIY